jgi:hypothetical protein
MHIEPGESSDCCVDIRVRSKERDLGSRRAGVRRFNSCSTHHFFIKLLFLDRYQNLCPIVQTAWFWNRTLVGT